MDPSTYKNIFPGDFTNSLSSLMVRGEVLLALFLLSPEVLNSMASWSLWPRQPQIPTVLIAIRLFVTQTNFTNQRRLIYNPGLKSLLFREILQQLHLTGKPPLALNSK